jgi:hypothetical protein
VLEAFARARIDLPFPQRDLHVREPLRVEISGDRASGPGQEGVRGERDAGPR